MSIALPMRDGLVPEKTGCCGLDVGVEGAGGLLATRLAISVMRSSTSRRLWLVLSDDFVKAKQGHGGLCAAEAVGH